MRSVIVFLLVVLSCNAHAATNFWQSASTRNLSVPGERKIIPQQGSVMLLDDVAFRGFQPQVPAENSGQYVLVDLPQPDGSLRTFRVFERACMEPALAAKYPMIKTYQAIAEDDPFVTGKLDYTVFGFHAMVFGREGVYFIDPYTNVNTGFYNVYYKKDYLRQQQDFSVCQTPAPPSESSLLAPSSSTGEGSTDIVADTKIRTFRLALACTIEYSAAVAGPTPTKPAVLSAMVTSVNRVNGVWEKDLSIHLNLIPNNDTLIFITSDSYSNNDGATMLGQNKTIINARIGLANYDIGHVFSTGGGGIAGLGVVCSNDKAHGVTGSSNPVGDAYDIDYVIHEMGHQFGANHTFNAATGSCSGNRVGTVAYEPGSGTTIMAYAGICGTNDIMPHSDDYFHRASIVEIANFISGITCDVETSSGNTIPTVISYVSTYYIPYKTPFEITALASDPNGDPIKYCWEEWDLGPAGSWNSANLQTAPILRSFLPSYSPTRVFPTWDSLIINSIRYRGEVLPEVTRDVKFRCTVRDIRNGYGTFNAPDANLLVKSVNTGSLFRVSSFATNTTITGNTTQTITWDLGGTDASPISCTGVDILLSLDSARTFPFVLATNTANDGSEQVTIPDVFTANASARIKVKGNGNIFFDLNNGWLKINAGLPQASFTVSDTAVCAGGSLTFTNTSAGPLDSLRWTIGGGTPSTSTSATTVTPVFNTPGTYTVSLRTYRSGNASVVFSKTITVKPVKTTNLSQTICEGSSVTIGSQTFTTNGLHTVVLQTSLGCDSTVNLTLTVNPKKTTNLSQTICEGGSVTIGSQTFTTNGLHTVVLQTSLGCDSTVNLTLTVNPKKTTNLSQSICEGGSVTIGSQTFTTSGPHTVVLQTSLGCDSTVNLNLTVNPKKTTNLSQTICEGGSVTIGSQTFTTSGPHTVVLQTSLGCDSTVNLNLTVNPKKTTNLSQTICEGGSVTIGSQTFTTNGPHTVVLQTSLGCDSTVNLNLTVNPNKTTNLTQTICNGQSVTIGSQTFTTDGPHTVVLQTSLGCDSTVNLDLTVAAIPATATVILRNDSLVATGSSGAAYQWYLGGVLKATTTIPAYKPSEGGSWVCVVVSSEGCLSADSDPFVVTGLRNNNATFVFDLLPNPARGQFELQLNAKHPGNILLTAYTVTGQLMFREELTVQAGRFVRRFNTEAWGAGMYFITLTDDSGSITRNLLVQ